MQRCHQVIISPEDTILSFTSSAWPGCNPEAEKASRSTLRPGTWSHCGTRSAGDPDPHPFLPIAHGLQEHGRHVATVVLQVFLGHLGVLMAVQSPLPRSACPWEGPTKDPHHSATHSEPSALLSAYRSRGHLGDFTWEPHPGSYPMVTLLVSRTHVSPLLSVVDTGQHC